MNLLSDFETYLKTKIEKLAHLESENLDCKSPDYHEHFSTKSFDESKASVYFTPTEGHLSPQPMQLSPIHINYINEGMIGCEAAGYNEDFNGHWRSIPLINVPRNQTAQRNSFTLPFDYLDEEDEAPGNFIVPDPVYVDESFMYSSDRFHGVDGPSTSMMMPMNSSDLSSRRRRKKYKDHRRSRQSIENETLLMQDIVHDVSKGARPKVYGFHPRKLQDPVGEHVNPTFFDQDTEDQTLSACSSNGGVKKVNSLLNIDEKTGKVSAISTSNDLELATNIDGDDKMIGEKVIKMQSSNSKMQSSNSLPDLQTSTTSSTPSPSETDSSNSNNQILGHGKHVILAVEAQNDEGQNQMDFEDGDHQAKAKIKLNIDQGSGSSSSSSSNNLKYGSVSTPSTL